ncbi:MAG: hypothetical protein M3Z07_01645 [Candidatus Eremiobacteraeota bacterium]|nr:hypothetical protein [Candidatus Eremiobacteraeota bacterium]
MWEAVTATGTVISALVIGITVIFASKQVRVGAEQAKITNAQLNHLRKSTQLQGAMEIFLEMDRPDFREAVRFVLHDLKERMTDEVFRSEVAFPEACDDTVHKENLVLRAFERIGAYVRGGLLDGDLLYTVVPTVILSTWEHLAAVVAIQRESISVLKAENFEYLYNGAKIWSREHEYAFSDKILRT